jgi:hypothetical protein
MELPANPMKTVNTCLTVLGLSLAGSVAAAADPADCAKLSQLKLPDTRIEGAEAISGTPRGRFRRVCLHDSHLAPA